MICRADAAGRMLPVRMLLFRRILLRRLLLRLLLRMMCRAAVDMLIYSRVVQVWYIGTY